MRESDSAILKTLRKSTKPRPYDLVTRIGLTWVRAGVLFGETLFAYHYVCAGGDDQSLGAPKIFANLR